MSPRVSLSAVAGPLEGRTWTFEAHDTFLFGRSPDCHAGLPESDDTASRHHFLLEVNPPAARVRDLGSLNGTWVNGVRHGGRAAGETPEEAARRSFPEVDLRHGDEVRVGTSRFRVDVVGADTADTAPPEGAVSVPGYELGRLLGRGGMGAVYLARRHGDATTVALKVLMAQAAVETATREAFLREVDVTRALHHPAIVRLHDHGAAGGTFFFAMEYCAGGSVQAAMLKQGAPWPLGTVAPLALAALDGLAHAHERGFVHRDLKPENLLLSGAGLKISDFGLAKSFQQAGLSGMTATGTAAGTLSFMPREQLTSYRHVRPASDVWSMAATLYFMLTRQLARDFRPGVDPLQVILKGGTVPLRARDPRLPAPLAAVIDRALDDDVNVRHATAGELREDILRVLP
jgi:serine/threonine protein kinase